MSEYAIIRWLVFVLLVSVVVNAYSLVMVNRLHSQAEAVRKSQADEQEFLRHYTLYVNETIRQQPANELEILRSYKAVLEEQFGVTTISAGASGKLRRVVERSR